MPPMKESETMSGPYRSAEGGRYRSAEVVVPEPSFADTLEKQARGRMATLEGYFAKEREHREEYAKLGRMLGLTEATIAANINIHREKIR